MVGVSIVSHGHCKYLPALLESLEANDLITSIVIRINDKFLEDEEYLNTLILDNRIRIECNEHRLGFGANHNLNSQLIHEDYLLILNPDTILNNLTEIGDLVVPKVLDQNGNEAENGRKFISPWNLFLRLSKIKPGSGSEWFGGMGILVSRQVFNRVSGFDESYFMYVEDCDFFWRLSKMSIKPTKSQGFLITHYAQKSSHKSASYFRRHFRSILVFWGKRYLNI
ncbi:MAG: hypothetical protein ACJ0QP_05295 [Schleiferiaceae bacterium]